MLLEANERLQQSKSADPRRAHDLLERLVHLYQAWDTLAPNTGKAAQAEEWKKKLEAVRTETESGSKR